MSEGVSPLFARRLDCASWSHVWFYPFPPARVPPRPSCCHLSVTWREWGNQLFLFGSMRGAWGLFMQDEPTKQSLQPEQPEQAFFPATLHNYKWSSDQPEQESTIKHTMVLLIPDHHMSHTGHHTTACSYTFTHNCSFTLTGKVDASVEVQPLVWLEILQWMRQHVKVCGLFLLMSHDNSLAGLTDHTVCPYRHPPSIWTTVFLLVFLQKSTDGLQTVQSSAARLLTRTKRRKHILLVSASALPASMF